jgi:hypothetical protein
MAAQSQSRKQSPSITIAVGLQSATLPSRRPGDRRKDRDESLWKDEIAIIEFGSFTRPFCAMAAQAMEILIAYLYASRVVRSVSIYTREAHPGENYRHDTSIEDKRRNARAFREQSGVCHQILLDDLGGSAHRPRGSYSL